MFNKSTIIHLQDKEINLFEYIDRNSDYLKKKYLNIVFRISNLKIYNQSLNKIFEYNDHSLWEMSLINEKNIYKNNFVFKTIKYLAIKKILDGNLNKKIRISHLERDLANILKYEVNNENIIFENYNFNFLEIFQNIVRKSSTYNHIYFFYFFLKNCNFKKKTMKNVLKKKFFIFSYFTHYDPKKFLNRIFYPKQWSQLWDITNHNANFMQLFLPNKKFKFFFQIKNFLSKTKFDNLNEENFINNNIFFEYYKKVVNDYKNFKKRIDRLDLKKIFQKNKEYEFFYLINEESFISSFSGYILLQNLLWIRVFDDLLSSIPKHEYGIFLYENQPWEKALITSWKKFNHGYLIGYSHTTINYWHLNYFNDPSYNLSNQFKRFNPDFIAVSSEISKNFLLSQSIDSKNIVEVEALRYLWLIDKIHLHKDKTKKKILFLGDYKASINKKLINILNQSKNDLIKLNFDITFKPHPATSAKNINDKIAKTNEDLELLIDKFEYIISSNTTSAIIEALSRGVRTFLFKDKNNFDLSPLKNTILEEEIVSFYTKEDLLNEIETNKERKNIKPINYYYLDKDIKKWKKILKIED
jgi:surface carbohydrate biosynthesis protein (TIGR04326 family)